MRRNIYEETYNKYIQIIASQLNYLEVAEKLVMKTATAKDINKLSDDGYLVRYRNDPIFNAKVQMVVASLMTEFNATLEDAIAERLENK